MAIAGLVIDKSASNYRLRRFLAFLLDAVIVLVILFVVYTITGRPDFPAVKAAMNAAGSGSSTPDAQKLANTMFSLFDAAYWQSLFIWFVYEVLSQLALKGATPGKLMMKLRIVPENPGRSWILHNLLMIVRSALKFGFMYIFQGFPFLIAELSVFANREGKAGFDYFVKTRVKDMNEGVRYETNCELTHDG